MVRSLAPDYDTYSGKRIVSLIHRVSLHPLLPSLCVTASSALVPQVNTLVTLCMLMVRWKRAELKHRAREARSKQE